MVNARKDMLDAEQGVRAGDAYCARRRRDHKRRRGRREPRHFRAAVYTFQTNEYIGPGRAETRDVNFAAAQTTRAPDGPAFSI